MSRPKRNRVRTNVAIESPVFSQLELILSDPVKGGFRYGALSEVINRLLQKWLDTANQPGVDLVKFLEAYGVALEK